MRKNDIEEKKSQSGECGGGACGSNNTWGHDGTSSQSSVSGMPQSHLKEHDYIGISEVSSSLNEEEDEEQEQEEELEQEEEKEDEEEEGEGERRNKIDLNLRDTELSLGPLTSFFTPLNSGAPFQPNLSSSTTGAATHEELELKIGFRDGKKKMQQQKQNQKQQKMLFDEEESCVTKHKNMVTGAKRVFAEAIAGDGNFAEGRMFPKQQQQPLLPPLYPWKSAKQEKKGDSSDEDSARAPVGWPPVQSFRKNTLALPHHKKQSETKSNTLPAAAAAAVDCMPSFVKVYMDGVPIGRKVHLKSHDGYDKLFVTLEDMFLRFITGQCGKEKATCVEEKKINFLSGSDYVLTYEDKDGDLMLVGDVPWRMFLATVRRLRIMKGSDAIGLSPQTQRLSSEKVN